jgi:regulatory protein
MESSRQQLSYKEAVAKASEICSHAEKCSYDVELKCREWQLSREETTKLISYLVQEKFIDQQRYATSFVHDKFRFNKWGKIKLSYTLRQKQIEDKYIREAIASLPDDEYRNVLNDLLTTKAKTVKEKDPYTRRNKLLAFAQSKGFGVDEALKLIGGM